GLTRKILHKLASERDEQCWQDFRQLILHTFQGDGSEFIFVDETSKDKRTWAHHYGRAMSGACASLSDVFVRGDQYSLVAAMTIDGYIAADIVEGLYDRELFYVFITQQVLPMMHLFLAERSVIVLDNCCIHHNEELEAEVQEA
ncbi:hypothetical protein SCLCIDRAFT_39518, partial [Scleroderma citrinum Foug A]